MMGIFIYSQSIPRYQRLILKAAKVFFDKFMMENFIEPNRSKPIGLEESDFFSAYSPERIMTGYHYPTQGK
jgi:hypothetical protein